MAEDDLRARAGFRTSAQRLREPRAVGSRTAASPTPCRWAGAGVKAAAHRVSTAHLQAATRSCPRAGWWQGVYVAGRCSACCCATTRGCCRPAGCLPTPDHAPGLGRAICDAVRTCICVRRCRFALLWAGPDVFRRGSVRSEGSGPASRRVGRRGAADPGDGDHPRHRADRGASAPGRQVKDAGAKLVWSPQATCACTATPPMPPAP